MRGKESEKFMTIPESEVAHRIRRKLRQTEQMLRKSRGERQEVNLLRYYVLDALPKMPEPHCPMLEACARKVGVLRPNETVAE